MEQEHDADILAPSANAAPMPTKSAAPAGGAAPTPPPPAPVKADPGGGGEAALGGESQVRARLQQLLGTRHTELKTMLLEPSCSQRPVQCYVLRHKSRMGATKFDFYMSLSSTKDMYCFTGKKTSSHLYVISLDQVIAADCC